MQQITPKPSNIERISLVDLDDRILSRFKGQVLTTNQHNIGVFIASEFGWRSQYRGLHQKDRRYADATAAWFARVSVSY